MSLAHLQQGNRLRAMRYNDVRHAACRPPGLFTEEFDARQRQLRGNMPQAFVQALLLECAQRSGPEWPRRSTEELAVLVVSNVAWRAAPSTDRVASCPAKAVNNGDGALGPRRLTADCLPPGPSAPHRTTAEEPPDVVDRHRRTFAVPDPLVVDGSVLLRQGSANPALTIAANPARAAGRFRYLGGG